MINIVITIFLLGTSPDFQEQMRESLRNLRSEYHYDRLKGFQKLDALGMRAIENLAQNPPKNLPPNAVRLLEKLVMKHPSPSGLTLLFALAEEERCLVTRLHILVTLYAVSKNMKDLPAALRRRVAAIPDTIKREFGKDVFFSILVHLGRDKILRIINELRQQGYLQGSYPGQFARLRREVGEVAQYVLLRMLEAYIKGEAKPDTPDVETLTKALSDVADQSILKQLERIYTLASTTKRRETTISAMEVVLYRLGRKEPLLRRLNRLKSRAEGGDNSSLFTLIYLAGRAGIYETAEKYQRLRMLRRGATGVDHYNLACYLSMQGKVEEALKELEKSFRKGYRDLSWIMRDGEIAKARNDPRFKELLKKYFPNAVQEEKKK